jgi:hypothetical protein
MEKPILDIEIFEKEREIWQQRISESADQRERAESALLDLARSGDRNPTYILALLEKIRCESIRIRAAKEEVARYETIQRRAERMAVA